MKLQNKVLTSKEKSEVKSFLLKSPVIQVKEGAIKADNNGTAIENAKKWAENHTQEIIRLDIGKVVFDVSDLKNTAIPFQTPGAELSARPQRGIAIYLNLLRDILDVKL